MKKIFRVILMVLILPSSAFAANGYWDSMIWGQDNWYVPTGNIFGQVTTSVTGQTTNIIESTITIFETGQTATSDADGNYTLNDVPVGIYTIQITKDNFDPLLLTNIEVQEEQSTPMPSVELSVVACAGVYTQNELDQAVIDERRRWDINDDNRIGLGEAIHALQVVSGIRSD
jgi:carboxypeptidase family protein